MANTQSVMTLPPRHRVPRVVVHASEGGGWDIDVEFDGGAVTMQHCDDWLSDPRERIRIRRQSRALRGLKTELLNAVPDLVAIEPEQFRRLRLVSAASLEGLLQHLSLDLFEVHATFR